MQPIVLLCVLYLFYLFMIHHPKEATIKTTTNKKITAIDFLKGYSILAIVVFHLGQIMNPSPTLASLINFGGTGVHAFIFISGFGLFLSHLAKPLSYKNFLKKRFTKIYIPYILIVALSALISLFIPVYDNSLYAFLGHVFLYKMFDERIIGSYGYQFWFVSTIIQFYLIFPLLVQLKKRIKESYFVIAGFLISICWAIFIYNAGIGEMRIWGSFFLQFIWEFMLGMVCAERFYRKGFAFWEQKLTILAFIAAIGIGLYSLMAIKLGVVGHIFNDIPAFFGFTAFGLFIFHLRAAWINRVILFTASVSYPLFLIHFLVLLLVVEACQYYGLAFSLPAAALTLLLCYLAAVLLSRLFRRWGIL